MAFSFPSKKANRSRAAIHRFQILLQLERQCRVGARRVYESYPAAWHLRDCGHLDHCVGPWISQHHSRDHSFGLFLLPGGRPLPFIPVIHFGGRPRLPRPKAIRSRTRIACSIPSRSALNSANIFAMSIAESVLHRAGLLKDLGFASARHGRDGGTIVA
jgi:hypothetical protein